MSLNFEKIYINGQWTTSASNLLIDVENPATLEVFAQVPDGNQEDINRAVQAAYVAQKDWGNTSLDKRIEMMQKMFDIFKTYQKRIIELEVKELGAPVSFTTQTHCLLQFDRIASYIECAHRVNESESLKQSTVYREPIGVVACITPWNYPLGQVIQKVIPAILMGNTVVLKPSQHTPLTAYLLVEAFDKAGFPNGVINLVTGRGSEIGHLLATHPLVNMVSFTGSTRVGIELSRQALESVKRISLELGGKSPFIWMKSDDYSPAIPKLFSSIFLNSGQTCTSLSRLLVPEEDLEKIESLLLKHVQDYTVGDPWLTTTKIGPVSSLAQFQKIRSYIQEGLNEGAHLLTGGLPDEPTKGYFIKPTIFTHVKNSMKIAQEEIFGPVLCVITYKTIEEAIEIANDTVYGLNAAVFGPRERAISVACLLYTSPSPRDA